MSKPSREAYDVVIIGAGIGGLVCGCYLAKAGLKVLICEQHHKPGGYCTSFKRQGFTFDAAAHAFGGYREGGIVRRVLEDIGADKKLKVHRFDPSDTIVSPQYTVSYRSDISATISEYQSAFPGEHRSLNQFFSFAMNPNPHSFSRIRSWTFQQLLDSYFSDSELKFLLAAPLLGIGGLPPSMMSAFIGVKLFSEFLLDGGYHPEGGMQALADVLSERFIGFGGTLRVHCRVEKIKIADRRAEGIVIGKGSFVPSKYVISNCDARQTLTSLVGKRHVEEEFYASLLKMTPSLSNFIIYLGLDRLTDAMPKQGTCYWHYRYHDLDRAYANIQKGKIEDFDIYMLRVLPGKPTVTAITPAKFKNKTYWTTNKASLLEAFVRHIENSSIRQVRGRIVCKFAATPQTLNRYTSNYKGAAFGWEGTPAQLAVTGLKKPSVPNGLYMTGHWTTQGLGISGVSHVGYDTAKIILKKCHQR